MHDMPVLDDLVLVFAASVLVSLVFRRLRQPAIAGFIAAGALIGPHGAALVGDPQAVETLAELGVVLLLFTIGLELSLAQLAEVRGLLLKTGGAQMGLTLIATLGVGTALGQPFSQALAVSFLVSMSSTALVLKALADRGELDAPHGKLSVGILLFQDLAVVPLMLLIPLLAGGRAGLLSLPVTLVKLLALLVLMVMVSRRVVPHLLRQIVGARSREVFLLSVILICLATAWLSSRLGLSLALGAFIAGLVISESEYAQQALGNILPFRDSFLSLFFVSVGMLIDLPVLGQHLPAVAGLVLALLAGKALVTGLAALLVGAPLRVAVQAGLLLAQVGEFSFILLDEAGRQQILVGELYQVLLASAALSMFSAPFVFAVAPPLADFLGRAGWLERVSGGRQLKGLEPREIRLEGHVIVVGYGLNGRNLARVLRQSGVPYLVLELNGDTVRRARAEGEPIYFGDVTVPEVLAALGVEQAKVLVLALSDPSSTRRAVRLGREMNRRLRIVARTRYVAELEPLLQLGANEVIPEEFETSVEIFSRVLRCYHIPREAIDGLVQQVRQESYEMLRDLHLPRQKLADLAHLLSEIEVETHRLPQAAHVEGRSLGELNLRAVTGASLVGLVRNGQVISNPGPDLTFKAGDILLLLGRPSELEGARQLLDRGELTERGSS